MNRKVISSFIFFLLIWLIRDLQVHPMRLFMYQSAFETLQAFMFVTSFRICKFKLPELLSSTLFFSSEWHYKFRALNLLGNSAMKITIFAGMCCICFSIALCIDLMLMLAKPFKMKENLVLIYTSVSILVSLIMTILMDPKLQ